MLDINYQSIPVDQFETDNIKQESLTKSQVDLNMVKLHIIMAFLDFRKAFDTVWRDGLFSLNVKE